MNIKHIKKTIKKQEYDFLKENKHLGNNIILLTLGGSYAYGMDINTKEYVSDIDLRGVALNNKEEILLGKDFEQVVEIDTDTTVYSFNKILQLLKSNNPNTIEILGCKPEHYLYLNSNRITHITIMMFTVIQYIQLNIVNPIIWLLDWRFSFMILENLIHFKMAKTVLDTLKDMEKLVQTLQTIL